MTGVKLAALLRQGEVEMESLEGRLGCVMICEYCGDVIILSMCFINHLICIVCIQ